MGPAQKFESLKARFGLPCRAGDERGVLRHTWLERRLLYELRVDRTAWLAAGPHDPLPEVVAGIPFQLKKLENFLRGMVDDFSPTQLIDQCPLKQLQEETKGLLRHHLHEAYLANGIILSLQADLRQATDAFAEISAQAETVWRTGDPTVKAEFLDLLEAKTVRLRDALLLPQGVVLP